MSLMHDLAETYLPAFTPTLSLTFGTNLFAGIMPDTPDTCVSVLSYPGSPPEYVMGAANPTPARSHPHIQVMVRNTEGNYLAAEALIEAIVAAYEGVVNVTINGTFYERVERIQDPSLLHRDARRRLYFGCNLAVTRGMLP